ncbi:MAG: DUF1109 domain-containing protein [Propionivibrio sp.]
MKTDDLISLLATGAGAVQPHAAERRYAKAIGIGLLGAVALMLSLLRIRSDLIEAVSLPMFWLKIGFVASLLAASLFAVLRLSRPGGRTRNIPGVLLGPVAIMWAIASYVLIDAAPEQRIDLFLGKTWRYCPLLIAVLSVPAFVSGMWAMRGLAPTRPRLAGFATGLLAGATATLIYSLHCPEIAVPFIGFWYLVGMMIPAAAGYWLGESQLRW